MGDAEAEKFFMVDPVRGELKLKASLLQDTMLAETYSVSQTVWVSDGGVVSAGL